MDRRMKSGLTPTARCSSSVSCEVVWCWRGVYGSDFASPKIGNMAEEFRAINRNFAPASTSTAGTEAESTALRLSAEIV